MPAHVSAENSKSAAEDWIRAFLGDADLKGQVVRVPAFESEEDCRFFYPRRALGWQQQVNTFVSRAVRKRGGKVERVVLDPVAYAGLTRSGEDTAETRRQWVESRVGLAR